jgi:hypothetical protein
VRLTGYCGVPAAQNKNSEFCAPLTSFDWNETDLNRLGTSSIDTTCTIWDIEVSHHERALKIPLCRTCAVNCSALLSRRPC